MKTCTCCEVSKPLHEFPPSSYRRADGSRGLRTQCRECDAEALLAHRYGLSREAFKELRASSSGVCEICGVPPAQETYARFRHTRLAVDHDHATGRIRGMLCYDCNHGLGKFKDSPERLAAAIAYLTK